MPFPAIDDYTYRTYSKCFLGIKCSHNIIMLHARIFGTWVLMANVFFPSKWSLEYETEFCTVWPCTQPYGGKLEGLGGKLGSLGGGSFPSLGKTLIIATKVRMVLTIPLVKDNLYNTHDIELSQWQWLLCLFWTGDGRISSYGGDRLWQWGPDEEPNHCLRVVFDAPPDAEKPSTPSPDHGHAHLWFHLQVSTLFQPICFQSFVAGMLVVSLTWLIKHSVFTAYLYDLMQSLS